jgi:hypothetical protein
MTATNSEIEANTGRSLDQKLLELRFCGDTLLAALQAAAARCEAGHLRVAYQELAGDFDARQQALQAGLGRRPPPAADMPELVDLSWLAARGVLPDEDAAITRRLRDLAHDLWVRCEDVLRGAPLWLVALVTPYAQAVSDLKQQLVEKEPKD